MPISRRHLLAGLGTAGLIGAVGTARAETERVLVWHGKTHPEFVRLLDEWALGGYHLRSLSLYGTPTAPLYAGIVTKLEKTMQQRCFASLSAGQLQAQLDHQAKEQFGPSLIAAAGSAERPLFAVVLEPRATMPLTRLALKSGSDREPDTIQGMVHEAKRKGLILRCAAAYGYADKPLFATIWELNENKVAWDADGIMDDERLFQDRLGGQSAGWARLKFVAPVPGRRFLSIYQDDQIGPWTVRDNLGAQQLQREIDAQSLRGLRPMVLQAAGADAKASRFTAVFATREDPAPRVWTATGPIANAAIDEAMKGIMTKAMIRQAGFAIVKGTRLVLARGYTFSEPDWPVTQPTTTFRLASVSKTIAALGIYQLIETGRTKFGDRMQDILQLRDINGGPPKDPRFNKVTIEHLLNHTSGLSPHALGSVAIRDAYAAAQPGRAAHFPVTAAMATSYMASISLISDPGEKSEYNNCAYFLLGQVLAKVRATETAAAALERDLFAPLGIKRIRRSRSLLTDQPPDEARYRASLGRDHIRVLTLGRSVMSDGRPLAPLGYGQEHMEIHEGDGGLSAAMTDLARLIAIMIGRRDNPALRGDTMRLMLTNAAARRGHGFDAVKDRGNDVFYGQKGGSLLTSWNVLQFNGDLGFAVVWSGGAPESDAKWYPDLPTVMNIARGMAWGDDLFPQFGMQSFL